MNYIQEHPLMMILILIIILFIFYLDFYYFAFYASDFANPVLFGDFLGGVLGTILTAIAAIFVYRTYLQVEAQKEDYELRKKERDLNFIDNLYDKISKDIDDLEVTFFAPGASDLTKYKGIYVLYNFSTLYQKDNSVLNKLALVLISYEYLFKLTDGFETKWNQELPLYQDRNY